MIEIRSYNVFSLVEGDRLDYSDHTLTVNTRELLNLLCENNRLKNIEINIVNPGEMTRIVHILDIFEARIRDKGSAYPGFDSPPWGAGQGVIKRYTNMGIMIAAEMPKDKGGLRVTREAIMDMGGSGARYSPFSSQHYIVITAEPAENVANAEFDDALRKGAIKIAEYVARVIKDSKPDDIEVFDEAMPISNSTLPKIAYIYQVQSQGPLLQTFYYGETMDDFTPTLVQPTEILGGALVSGNHSHMTIPTYVHVNNPVLKGLYRHNRVDLNLLPVILTEGHAKTSWQKERRAHHVLNLLRFLGADGVVLTQEGGGMSMIDQFMMCRLCEENHIKTTVITFEMCGEDGKDFPLLDVAPNADAIVTVGNRDELVNLPAVTRVIGGNYVRDGRKLHDMVEAEKNMCVRLSTIYGALNQTGLHRIKSVVY